MFLLKQYLPRKKALTCFYLKSHLPSPKTLHLAFAISSRDLQANNFVLTPHSYFQKRHSCNSAEGLLSHVEVMSLYGISLKTSLSGIVLLHCFLQRSISDREKSSFPSFYRNGIEWMKSRKVLYFFESNLKCFRAVRGEIATIRPFLLK